MNSEAEHVDFPSLLRPPAFRAKNMKLRLLLKAALIEADKTLPYSFPVCPLKRNTLYFTALLEKVKPISGLWVEGYDWTLTCSLYDNWTFWKGGVWFACVSFTAGQWSTEKSVSGKRLCRKHIFSVNEKIHVFSLQFYLYIFTPASKIRLWPWWTPVDPNIDCYRDDLKLELSPRFLTYIIKFIPKCSCELIQPLPPNHTSFFFLLQSALDFFLSPIGLFFTQRFYSSLCNILFFYLFVIM